MTAEEIAHWSDLDLADLLAFDTARTHQGLSDFVADMTNRLGLCNTVYHCPSFVGHTIEDPFLVLTYKPDWVTHYKQSNYVAIDPVFNVGARSVLPIDWSTLDISDKKVVKLFNEAADAGVGKQGLTIPVRGPDNGLWALFSVTTNDSDADWSKRRRTLTSNLVLLAHFVHQKAYDLHRGAEKIDLNAVTKRECEALAWTAEGKSVADIAVLMRISVETVKAHLDSARFKLSALNRVHAVTKAIRAGIIR